MIAAVPERGYAKRVDRSTTGLKGEQACSHRRSGTRKQLAEPGRSEGWVVVSASVITALFEP